MISKMKRILKKPKTLAQHMTQYRKSVAAIKALIRDQFPRGSQCRYLPTGITVKVLYYDVAPVNGMMVQPDTGMNFVATHDQLERL